MPFPKARFARLILLVFRWFCRPRLYRAIEGDLIELYLKYEEEQGRSRANWMLLREIMLLFRPRLWRVG
ncbi:MAG TPA: hypothetical protein DCR93_02030, partial [Cytophagales bacterium]|nr:hypothetical protein [Cytophagales bacterium]